MHNGVVLHASSFIGSSAGTSVQWSGGRTVLTLAAQQYGGGVFLQGLVDDPNSGNDRWVSLNGTTYSANQFTAYDLPPGQYRMISNVGSSINLVAKLNTVPY